LVEEGIVGLMIHLGILFYVMISSLIVMFKIKDPILKYKISALIRWQELWWPPGMQS
jgi:hypothetical protein